MYWQIGMWRLRESQPAQALIRQREVQAERLLPNDLCIDFRVTGVMVNGLAYTKR